MDVERRSSLDVDMAKDPIVAAYLKDTDTAKSFYRALCNMQWRKINPLPEADRIIEKLKGIDSDLWSCSWRYAGGVIADIRNANYNVKEGYMDYYCSGDEGKVDDIVKECFNRMGWKPAPWDDENDV